MAQKTNFTAELIEGALPGVSAHDAEGMAKHAARIKEVLDIVVSRPDDFYFSLVVVGKDGSSPYTHGTMPAILMTLSGIRDMDAIERAIMTTVEPGSGLAGYKELYQDLATYERPELRDQGEDEESGVLTIEFLPALDGSASVLGARPGVGDFDVAGPQPVAEETEEHRLARLADDGNPHAGD